MCISQFRDYCKASRFSHSRYNEDSLDNNLEVKKGTQWHHGRAHYYITNLKIMRELSMNNNPYAKMHLRNIIPNSNHEMWRRCPNCDTDYDRQMSDSCPYCLAVAEALEVTKH